MKKSWEKYVTDQIQTSSWSFELVFSKQSILFWRSATVQLQQGRESIKTINEVSMFNFYYYPQLYFYHLAFVNNEVLW